MNRELRAGLILLIISILLTLPSGAFRGTVNAASFPETMFSGRAVLEGPVTVDMAVNPPVTTPGQTISVQIKLTNNQAEAATPTVLLALPLNLTYTDSLLPAGATYQYAENTLSWRPLLRNQGAVAEITLTFHVGAADLHAPEKEIVLILIQGEQSQTATLPIWIGLPPQAEISIDPQIVSVGQPVLLTALTGGTGPFVQSWEFGDGRQITTPNPQIVFPIAGTYQVLLTLSNPLAAVEVSTSITVQNQPAAAFKTDRDRAIPFAPLQFTNLSGGEQPLTFLWDFGDGTTSTDTNPQHQFPTTGYYEVRLLVNSPLGVAETSQTIIIGNPPGADFMIAAETPTGVPLRAEAFFDATVNSLEWDMGDGAHYSGEVVEHIYRRAGTFTVTMTARNEFGDITISKDIQIVAGSFDHFLPLMHRHDLSRPAVLGPVPERTPLQYFGLAYQDGLGVAGTPGGAGPEIDNLPAAVMPQVTEAPPTLDSVPAEAVAGGELEEIALPPQPPLPPGATPAEALLWYINEARRLHNLPPVLYSYELSIAAQVHSEDMLFVPGILHVGSDGSRPEVRQYRFGWTGYYAGEAVAWGWESPLSAVEFWVNSPPHRIIILNPTVTHAGVGYAANANAPNIWYWTAEFGLSLTAVENPPASPQ